MQYNIIYSGIRERVKTNWNIKKLERIIQKINIEKKDVFVSETYNDAPLIFIKLFGENLHICIDSMGEKST